MLSPSVHPLSPSESIGEATFTLLAARVGVSPFPIRIARAVELHPWLNVEAGQLRGSGSSSALITDTHDKGLFWLSIQEALEARWAVQDSLWIMLDLRAAEPLFPHTFSFFYPVVTSPPTRITSVPFLQGIVGLGIGGQIL
jgi:hypothetical protein